MDKSTSLFSLNTKIPRSACLCAWSGARSGLPVDACPSCRLLNWLIHRIIDAVFHQVDYNKDGRLEPLEIEIAILKVYNIINKRLPGWQNPPTRAQIRTALKVFDVDGNGALDKWVGLPSLCEDPLAMAGMT